MATKNTEKISERKDAAVRLIDLLMMQARKAGNDQKATEALEALYQVAREANIRLAIAASQRPEIAVKVAGTKRDWPLNVLPIDRKAGKQARRLREELRLGERLALKPWDKEAPFYEMASRVFLTLERERDAYQWDNLDSETRAFYQATADEQGKTVEVVRRNEERSYRAAIAAKDDADSTRRYLSPIEATEADTSKRDSAWRMSACLLPPLSRATVGQWVDTATLYFEAEAGGTATDPVIADLHEQAAKHANSLESITEVARFNSFLREKLKRFFLTQVPKREA